MIEAIRKAWNLRSAYKRALSGRDGDQVITDLIRKYILASPVKDSAEITMFNLGKQQCAIEILRKVLGSDESFRKAMEQAIETTNEQA